MVLRWQWPWAILIAALVAAGIMFAAAAWINHRMRSQETAESYYVLDDLDTEQGNALMRVWHTLNRVATVLVALALVTAVVLVGRPSAVDKQAETSSSRDIVLCLDVSGSTLPYDHQVLDTYAQLVQHFQGERIGLSIFNSTSRTVFPLTDDYSLVSKQLTQASDMLRGVETQDDIDKMTDRQYQQVSDWLEGTQNRNDATSLIGDGLVSCAAMLPGFTYSALRDGAKPDREASIVLATDNVVSGTETYSLKQALTLTKQAGITVDGLYSGPKSSEQDAATQTMKKDIEGAGGMFLTQSDGSSVEQLVREIDKRQVSTTQEHGKAAVLDAPGWWTLALAVFVLAWLIMAWRLKR